MKKIILFILIIGLVLVSGCFDMLDEKRDESKVFKSDTGEEYNNLNDKNNLISIEDIKNCLKKPYHPSWEKIDTQIIVVNFKDKSDLFIFELADSYNISNIEIAYKSDNLTFTEFNIQNGLSTEKICGFLNNDYINYYYLQDIVHTL